MPRRDPLFRAWLALVVLSGASALLARASGKAVGLAVLLIGLIKARLILIRYLRLGEAPAWLRGFDAGLVLLTTCLTGLYLAG